MAKPSHVLSRRNLHPHCILALQGELEVLRTPVLSGVPYSLDVFSSAQAYRLILKVLLSL